MYTHDAHGLRAALFMATLLFTGSFAQAEPVAERLYPGKAPGSEQWTEPEVERPSPRGGTILENVREPTLTAYAPASPPEGGTAVILLPGGALRLLSIDEDTHYVIRTLNARGITVFVLKYRVLQQHPQPREASPGGGTRAPAAPPALPKLVIRNANANPAPDDAALTTVLNLAAADAQRALQMVRDGARRWHIDPAHVGFLGYSAGGGVALAEYLLAPAGQRPDFIATSYGPSLMDVRVGADAPPLFIATETQHGPVTDGLLALAGLWHAANRPVELHMYDVPMFAMPSTLWCERFLDWLSLRRLVPAAAGIDGHRRVSLYVPSFDGTRLAVDVYRPTRAGALVDAPLPVLFSQMRGGLRQQATRAGDAHAPAMIRPFLEHGYVVVAQDRRGEGASFGRQTGFVTRDDARDGAAVVEWAAAQPWSTGKVGAIGCSNQGAYQLPLAAEHPPHLVAVAPECASPFFFDTMISPNGVSAFAMGAARPYAGECDDRAPMPPGEPVDDDVGGGSPLAHAAAEEHRCNAKFLGQYQANMHRDTRNDFLGYAPGLVDSIVQRAEAVRSSGVRIYHMGGWFDASPGAQLQAWQLFGGRVIIGPWLHCGREDPGGGFADASVDRGLDQLRWFDLTLKGIDTGIGSEPPVRFYTMHAAPGREWHNAPRWPLPDQQVQSFYFDAGPTAGIDSRNAGVLTSRRPRTGGEERYQPDYGTALFDGKYNELHRFWEGDMAATDRRGMTYTLAPVTADLQVTGHPVVHLWVSSTAADEDFFAVLEDVGPDGRSTYVTDGKIRASRRRLAVPPWGDLGTPWHAQSTADDVPLQPGVPAELVFDMTPTSWVFRTGHRVRITVLNAVGQRFQVPAAWDRTKPPTLGILRGANRASRVDLPVIPATSRYYAGGPADQRLPQR